MTPDLFAEREHLTSNAWISGCGRYRYCLERRWSNKTACVFIMLNPSTADATEDDPTIRRCIGFARLWGFGGVVVANLYAYRATDPRELRKADDPIGPENDEWLVRLLDHPTIVCAWGAHADDDRVDAFRWLVRDNARARPLYCLGVTKHGAPKHPLYLAKGTGLIEWRWGVLP